MQSEVAVIKEKPLNLKGVGAWVRGWVGIHELSQLFHMPLRFPCEKFC